MYDEIIIILIVLIIIASLYIITYKQNNNSNSEITTLKTELNELKKKVNEDDEEPEINVNEINSNNRNNNIPQPPLVDPIVNYDRLKLSDPFIDPSQRTSIDQIPGPYFAPYINYPTRGIVDKYHRVGLLISNDKHHKYNELDDLNEEDNSNRITASVSTINNPVTSIQHDNLSQNNTNPPVNKKRPNTPHNVKIEPFGSIQDNHILELMGMKLYQNTYKYFTSFSEGNKIIKITINTKNNNRELFDGDEIYIPELRKKYRVKLDDIDGVLYNPYFF